MVGRQREPMTKAGVAGDMDGHFFGFLVSVSLYLHYSIDSHWGRKTRQRLDRIGHRAFSRPKTALFHLVVQTRWSLRCRNDFISGENIDWTQKINWKSSALGLWNERRDTHDLRNGCDVSFRPRENSIHCSVSDTVQSIGVYHLSVDTEDEEMIDARKIDNERIQSTSLFQQRIIPNDFRWSDTKSWFDDQCWSRYDRVVITSGGRNCSPTESTGRLRGDRH